MALQPAASSGRQRHHYSLQMGNRRPADGEYCASNWGMEPGQMGSRRSVISESRRRQLGKREGPSPPRRNIAYVLTVAEAAGRVGRNHETIRRWIRSGRLPSRRVGQRREIEDRGLRLIGDELFPMAKLPDQWQIGDDGSLARNLVAALHRSRSGHRRASSGRLQVAGTIDAIATSTRPDELDELRSKIRAALDRIGYEHAGLALGGWRRPLR